MRISRFATPAVLAALASTIGPACESSECVDEVCFDDTGGASSAARAGLGGAGDNPGGALNGGTGGLGTGGSSAGGSSAGTGGTAAGAAGAPVGGSSQTGIGGDLGGSDEGDAGAAGSGGEGGAPTMCDLTQSPTLESCLISDEHSIFVSPLGTENATGSKSDPLLSLATAIARADAEDKIVIACSNADAHFTLPLELTGEIDARVYGGFLCDDTWTWSADERTLVAPEAGVALKLESVSGSLAIENFEFRAPDADASEPGASSIAAIATNSEDVTFRRVTIAAGNGAAGVNGEEIAPYSGPNFDGLPAQGEAGGDPRTTSQCLCATTGGQGGNAEVSMNGDDGTPDYGGGKGKGGTPDPDCAIPAGRSGQSAPADTKPGAGAANLGSLNGVSWEPALGEPGSPGAPGQGGGGGAGAASGGGGGGACGGCGGKGGNPGTGGGASIALIAVNSRLTFTESVLQTGDGGAGGDGASGQTGQAGGFGGLQASGACPGGNGGPGAAGGPGGGGAGGMTVGIVYRGIVPETAGISFVLGDAGPRGQGGADGNFGISGKLAETHDADADL
jgi:hypothetical protein